MSTTSINKRESPTIREVEAEDDGGRNGGATQSQVAGGKDGGDGHPTKPEVPSTTASPRLNAPIDQDLFDSRPASPPHPAVQQEEEAYVEPQPEDLLPPPDFKPFFTLVSDPTTGEHHHPTVHYLFSDDDEEILTSAALRSLNYTDNDGGKVREAEDPEERVVTVDLAADGKTVTNVSSLSPEWQALRTEVGSAPSMGDAGEDESGERDLMLRISGSEADRGSERVEQGGVEDLVRGFGERIGALEDVLKRDG